MAAKPKAGTAVAVARAKVSLPAHLQAGGDEVALVHAHGRVLLGGNQGRMVSAGAALATH